MSKTVHADVVILGGGPTGTVAAIAAARTGADVLLVERYGFLGGTSTAAMVGPWMTFHAADGNQVIRGIPQEIVDRLVATGDSLGHIRDPLNVIYSLTPFDPTGLKFLLDDMIQEAGVRLLLHTLVVGAEVQNGTVRAARVVTRDGELRLEAPVFIDTTGDAFFAKLAGAPLVMGRPSDGLTQPMTLVFRMGNVDTDAVLDYMIAHPEEFHETTSVDLVKQTRYVSASGFFSLWKDAVASGEVNVPRDRLLFFGTPRPGQVLFNTVRVVNRNPVDPWDLTAAELEGRRQARQIADMVKRRVPGFADAVLLDVASQIGIRESRRIVGYYTLTEEDVYVSRQFEDGVANGAYPIDIHDPAGAGLRYDDRRVNGYRIPYRCLIPMGTKNLLVAGRCLSANHEALGTARITASCMDMGQAVGAAAALVARKGCATTELPVDELKSAIAALGGYVS
ncbi:FAD-dependent oxidoreductase [Symbiobacterium thermophilum]|uniref:FAD-dependent oxidoreductase n=1 Tax=Symbiobacterium thermophilum TaxID=2734 RepID=UPI002354302E|nr:FAD-dependent oxidoreductase [Symbiobacterium thermophilum]